MFDFDDFIDSESRTPADLNQTISNMAANLNMAKTFIAVVQEQIVDFDYLTDGFSTVELSAFFVKRFNGLKRLSFEHKMLAQYLILCHFMAMW